MSGLTVALSQRFESQFIMLQESIHLDAKPLGNMRSIYIDIISHHVNVCLCFSDIVNLTSGI